MEPHEQHHLSHAFPLGQFGLEQANEHDRAAHYTAVLDFLGATDKHQQLQKLASIFPNKFASSYLESMSENFTREVYNSMHALNGHLEAIGGIPSNFVDHDGVVMNGHVISSINYEDGLWTMLFRGQNSREGIPVRGTTAQLRASFLAATTTGPNEQGPE